MIDKKDIRIGINIYDEHENIVEVTIENFEDVFYDRGFFDPIQLTKEWLLKLGGKHHKPDYYTFGDLLIRFYLDENELLHCSVGDDEYGILYRIIKYVHQLQNLYFALTGYELKIEL